MEEATPAPVVESPAVSAEPLKRKVSIFFDRKGISIYKIIANGEESRRVTIANFCIDLIAKGEDDEGKATYLLRIYDGMAERLKVFPSGHFSNLTTFQGAITSLGFSFIGMGGDVSCLLDALIQGSKVPNSTTKKLIYLGSYAGRYKKDGYDFFVFRTGILTPEGFIKYGKLNEVEYKDTMIMIERNSETIRYQPSHQEPKDTYAAMKVPSFFKHQIYPFFKDSGYSILAFGWLLGTFFIDEVLENTDTNFYPFLFITGKRGAGKTQFVRMFRRIAGYDNEPVGYEGASVFSDCHEMMHCHSLPVWRDEFRNTKKTEMKASSLRGFYDRAGTPKGTKEMKTVNMPVSGTLIFTGEDMSEDPAAQRRNVTFFFGKDSKHEGPSYKNFLYQSSKWSQIFPAIYREGLAIDWSKLTEIYEAYSEAFRMYEFFEKYALLCAVFELFMADKLPRSDIVKKITQYLGSAGKFAETADSCEQFFDDLGAYFTAEDGLKPLIGETYSEIQKYIYDKDGEIGIYFGGLHPLYQKFKRASGSTNEGMSKAVLKQYFIDTYGAKEAHRGLPSGRQRVVIFESGRAPESLMAIVDNMKNQTVYNGAMHKQYGGIE